MNMALPESSVEQEEDPSLPFPIFKISSKVERYLLYDSNLITWLRRTHNILGVLIGTLPQFPQQNVFLGLPLELQPEEVRLLVEKEVAYVVCDFEWHELGLRSITSEQRREFLTGLHDEGKEAARVSDRRKEASREKTRERLQKKKRTVRARQGLEADDERSAEANDGGEEEEEESLFESLPLPSSSAAKLPSSSIQPTSSDQSAWTVTPTTSYPPLPRPPLDRAIQLPVVRPSSYALFKHLHAESYFLSPGLRFGCQFLVYPGDPLRFHSHFLAVGLNWDEEFDLLDLVGGGRLGTGVKKGWLIGGVERDGNDDENEQVGVKGEGKQGREGEKETIGSGQKHRESELEGDADNDGSMLDAEQASLSTKDHIKQNRATKEPQVRTFCLEWGGM